MVTVRASIVAACAAACGGITTTDPPHDSVMDCAALCRNAGEPCDNATCVASCEAGFVGLCAHEEKARYSCYMTQGLLECHEGILDHDQQPDVCEAENAAVTSCLCESEVVQCP